MCCNKFYLKYMSIVKFSNQELFLMQNCHALTRLGQLLTKNFLALTIFSLSIFEESSWNVRGSFVVNLK